MSDKATIRKTLREPTPRELREREVFIEPLARGGGSLRVHLAYPNNYWVAMSNLGFQAVYSLFSRSAAVEVERAFLPEHADQAETRDTPWRTFESARLLADCDILAFSLSFETDYLHLLRMLRNARLLEPDPLVREREADHGQFSRPLIIVGGTAITLNPEPIADLIDVVVLGEAEELIAELVAVCEQHKREGKGRLALLRALAQLEGVYVPRFYRPQYREDDTIDRFEVEPGVPARAQRRIVKDLSQYPTYTGIMTSETEFRNMFLVETGRGCEMGCRFCVAGYIYRPVRKRSEESISKAVEVGLQKSAAVGFVGASVSSHKSISKLAARVAEQGARASLSSLMSQKVTKELAGSISESEYKTVALAPEAGTERLRRAAGKRVSNEQILHAARELAEAGIRGFKLYFIVGLPTETDQDVDAIADLAIAVRDAVVEISKPTGKLAWVALSMNPFIPKAVTPFQWEPMVDRKVLDKKIARVRDRVRRVPNLELRFESPKESYFQALLSRGDRRVGRVLLHALEQGKDWKWLVQYSEHRLVDGTPPMSFYTTRRFGFDEILPWEVVDSRVDRKLLKREALRAHHGEEYREHFGDPGANEDTPCTLTPELIETAILG